MTIIYIVINKIHCSPIFIDHNKKFMNVHPVFIDLNKKI